MLYIGNWNKKEIIEDYIATHDVNKALVIYSKTLKEDFDLSIPFETLELADSTKYVNYYHLLEYVDKWTLVIIDNVLRSQQRRSLEHNCINVITNQSHHKLVFNYLPFINDHEDFMVLMDFNDKNKYSVELFNPSFIHDQDVKIHPVELTIDFIDVSITEKDVEKYEKARDKLFDELGESDPNTIPNNLSLVSGDIKYKALDDKDGIYIFRNHRVKGSNVMTFKDATEGAIMDFPIRRTDIIDMITRTKTNKIIFMMCDLKIDVYYKKDYLDWKNKLVSFYDEANIS